VEHGIIRDVMASLRWSLNLNRRLHISPQGYKKVQGEGEEYNEQLMEE
jgi:hypothetical protein